MALSLEIEKENRVKHPIFTSDGYFVASEESFEIW
jgi:hypothetical protein